MTEFILKMLEIVRKSKIGNETRHYPFHEIFLQHVQTFVTNMLIFGGVNVTIGYTVYASVYPQHVQGSREGTL